jgi:hypothetical protein
LPISFPTISKLPTPKIDLWTPGIHRIQAFWIEEGAGVVGETEEEGSSMGELAGEMSFLVQEI